MKFSSLLGLLAAGSLGALAQNVVTHGADWVPDETLHISRENMWINCEQRSTVVINGTLPAPTIRLKEGLTTWVRVHNDLADSNATIHWHGLAMSVAPFSDGTPHASQWPIPPGKYFDYQLVPQAGEAGTYFYHSHIEVQGYTATGAMIVDETGPPPYQYDEDRVVFLSDYYAELDEQLLDRIRDRVNYRSDPRSNNILINGYGCNSGDGVDGVSSEPIPRSGPRAGMAAEPSQGRGERSANGVWEDRRAGVNLRGGRRSGEENRGNNNNNNRGGRSGGRGRGRAMAKRDVSTGALSSLNVEPGKTYRLRFVGAVGVSFMSVAFEGHDSMQIIEADGHYTKPFETNVIQIGSGQRYSALLKTKTADQLNGKNEYLMQVETRENNFGQLSAYAVLNYGGTAESVDHKVPAGGAVEVPGTIYGWLDYELESLYGNSYPSAAEVTRTIVMDVKLVQEDDASRPFVAWVVSNQTPWYEDSYEKPMLVAMYENDTSMLPNYDRAVANGGFDGEKLCFPAKIGEVLDIVIQNHDSGSIAPAILHPFHAHGRHYWNLGSGPGTYNAAENEKKLQGKHSVLRDTTILYPRWPGTPANEGAGWRAWRWKVEDAGAWIIHCHILPHMILGMQSVWVFGDRDDLVKGGDPDAWQGYFQYDGVAYGANDGSHAAEVVSVENTPPGRESAPHNAPPQEQQAPPQQAPPQEQRPAENQGRPAQNQPQASPQPSPQSEAPPQSPAAPQNQGWNNGGYRGGPPAGGNRGPQGGNGGRGRGRGR